MCAHTAMAGDVMQSLRRNRANMLEIFLQLVYHLQQSRT